MDARGAIACAIKHLNPKEKIELISFIPKNKEDDESAWIGNVEKHLNEIYKKEICISPIKSLSLHLTNINSSYGLAPFINYKELWEENRFED